MSIDDTIHSLIGTGNSLVRFGDGEIAMMRGVNLALQNSNKELIHRMQSILAYRDEHLIIAIPDIFHGLSQYLPDSQRFWEDHLLFCRSYYDRYCTSDRVYGNASFSRCYITLQDKSKSPDWFSEIRSIWAGKKVTVVDMLPMDRIGQGGSAINLICLKDLLAKAEVEFRCSCRIEDITQQGVILTDEAGQRQEIACDNAVLSLGFRPDRAFTDSFAGTAREVYVVGDADRVANVWQANTTAFDKAMRI